MMRGAVPQMTIETPNLRLLPCEVAHFEALLRDENELAALLRVELAEEWLGFAAAQEAMQPSYEYLVAHPSALGWWTYLFVHTADNTLIGLGGFKGEPDENGVAEIGYSIAPSYQGRGLATEAARGMIEHAFSHPQVTAVIAHTLPETSASTKVLAKLGMQYDGAVIDPEDGEVWRWLSRKEDVQRGHRL
jgi:ribosomal-protein-alanine N-acetyltransferase